MLNMENELKKNECVDTTKKWERICPLCKCLIVYPIKSRYTSAVILNRTCRKCAKRTERVKSTSLYKQCPSCKKRIYFSNKESLKRSEKNKSVCNSCHYTGNIGRIQSEEEKEKRAIKLRGLVRTIESRKRYSLSKTGNKNPHFGKHILKSKEHKQKIRLGVINTLKRKFLYVGKSLKPAANPIACRIIDDYGNKNGYNFQHALNGGEYYISELGYWVDGYDKEKNVVIEYFEPWHSKSHHKDRDEKRRLEIIDFLKCSFIILKEDKITHGISEYLY